MERKEIFSNPEEGLFYTLSLWYGLVGNISSFKSANIRVATSLGIIKNIEDNMWGVLPTHEAHVVCFRCMLILHSPLQHNLRSVKIWENSVLCEPNIFVLEGFIKKVYFNLYFEVERDCE